MKYRSVEEYLRDWPDGVSGGKGEGLSKQTEQQQSAMQQQAFNLLQQRQNQVNDAVSKYLSGTEGFDPQQLALLRSQFLNSNAQQYQAAGRNVRTALLRTGSADSSVPAGGDYVRGISGLEGAEANNASSGLANIDLQNLQQALANKFNAASLINGQAATLTSPISTFGSGMSNALNQYVAASNSGFGANFMRSLGGALGTGVGAAGDVFLGGGLTKLGAPGFTKGGS